jgi:Ca2+-binding EF-hand superfamily protein
MTRISSLAAGIALATVLATGLASAQDVTPGAHFIENWDGDADGSVSLAEATEKRGDIFLTFDADEDGSLSAEEYVMFDEARFNDQAQMRQGKGNGQGKGEMMREEGGMQRAFNDTDGDGLVSREEFLARTPDWYAMMDRNGDGTVTQQDFGPGN